MLHSEQCGKVHEHFVRQQQNIYSAFDILLVSSVVYFFAFFSFLGVKMCLNRDVGAYLMATNKLVCNKLGLWAESNFGCTEIPLSSYHLNLDCNLQLDVVLLTKKFTKLFEFSRLKLSRIQNDKRVPKTKKHFIRKTKSLDTQKGNFPSEKFC